MRKFTGLNGNGGSVKRLSPSPKQLATLGHSAIWSQPGVDTGQSQALPILSTRLPTLTAGTDGVGVGAASLAQRFVQPTIPTRACCCRRLRARRPSSAPQHNVGTAIGAAQMECGGEGRAEGRGVACSLSKLGGCSQRKPGAEPLCVCVSTPLLSMPVPAEMHSRHKQPQAGLLQGRLDLLLVQFTAGQPWLPLVPSTRTADSLCCPWLLLTPNVVLGPEWQLTISMQGKTQA